MYKYRSNKRELKIDSLDISPVSCLILLRKLHKSSWGVDVHVYLFIIDFFFPPPLSALNVLKSQVFARGLNPLRYCEMMQ